jgi:hypothetical protein
LIITCLWRSLYLSASGPPSGSLRYAACTASLQPSGPPHARIRRVCPSIFNCQRPQITQQDCKSRWV